MGKTAFSAQTDDLSRRLAPLVRDMLLAEVERHAAERAQPSKADIDILECCRGGALAADGHAAVKFTAAEIPARRRLERAATALGMAMRRHGRMPKGE